MELRLGSVKQEDGSNAIVSTLDLSITQLDTGILMQDLINGTAHASDLSVLKKALEKPIEQAIKDVEAILAKKSSARFMIHVGEGDVIGFDMNPSIILRGQHQASKIVNVLGNQFGIKLDTRDRKVGSVIKALTEILSSTSNTGEFIDKKESERVTIINVGKESNSGFVPKGGSGLGLGTRTATEGTEEEHGKHKL